MMTTILDAKFCANSNGFTVTDNDFPNRIISVSKQIVKVHVNISAGFETDDIFNKLRETYPNVEILNMKSLNISEISLSNFKNLTNLTELFFGDNQLTKLINLTFSEATNLKKICLANNLISVIDKSAFETNGVLKEIHLENNKLKEIEPETFSYLSGLTVLWLYQNPFEVPLSARIFKNNSNLKDLNQLVFNCSTTKLNDELTKSLESSINKEKEVDTVFWFVIIGCLILMIAMSILLAFAYAYFRSKKNLNQIETNVYEDPIYSKLSRKMVSGNDLHSQQIEMDNKRKDSIMPIYAIVRKSSKTNSEIAPIDHIYNETSSAEDETNEPYIDVVTMIYHEPADMEHIYVEIQDKLNDIENPSEENPVYSEIYNEYKTDENERPYAEIK